MSEDPRLRVRLYIGGDHVVEEVWLDASNPDIHNLMDRLIDRQGVVVERAEEAGQVWMIEVYDPALPADSAYLRFGTDASGMVAPRRWR